MWPQKKPHQPQWWQHKETRKEKEIAALCFYEINRLLADPPFKEDTHLTQEARKVKHQAFIEHMATYHFRETPFTWYQALFCSKTQQRPNLGITEHCLKNCQHCPRKDPYTWEIEKKEANIIQSRWDTPKGKKSISPQMEE